MQPALKFTLWFALAPLLLAPTAIFLASALLPYLVIMSAETFQSEFSTFAGAADMDPDTVVGTIPISVINSNTAQRLGIAVATEQAAEQNVRSREQFCTKEPRAWLLAMLCMCVIVSALFLTYIFLTN